MVREVKKVTATWQYEGQRDQRHTVNRELEFTVETEGQRDPVQYAVWREPGTFQFPGEIKLKMLLRDLIEILP